MRRTWRLGGATLRAGVCYYILLTLSVCSELEGNDSGEQHNQHAIPQDDDDTGDTNADRALMRFELVEMLIRIAMQKFVAEVGGDGS